MKLMDIMGCNSNRKPLRKYFSRHFLFHVFVFHKKKIAVWWGHDASDFRPERFIDTPDYRWPRDAFLAFSAGSRSCIGQRAGQAQIIGIMSNLLRHIKLELPPHLLNMPFEKQRDALLRCWLGSSLTPTDIRLVFSPRTQGGEKS